MPWKLDSHKKLDVVAHICNPSTHVVIWKEEQEKIPASQPEAHREAAGTRGPDSTTRR